MADETSAQVSFFLKVILNEMFSLAMSTQQVDILVAPQLELV
jgi:hypothetical protein